MFEFEMGQYVFLNFPEISLYQWHPFTISSSPYDKVNIMLMLKINNSL